MTEDYVSFETAKLLKEKGFDGEYTGWIGKSGKYYFPDDTYYDDEELEEAQNDRKDFIPLVTLQMAMKWLLTMHHLLITTFSSSQESWMYRITKPHQRLEDGVYGEDYETREMACEAAIKYCLENLI